MSLLFYLLTRPNFTATREQVLDDLWPDGDPESGANSLNQSLHFLRREIDPWYEMGVSHDYVYFEGELVGLDRELVRPASTEFLRDIRSIELASLRPKEAMALVSRYSGQFCPEFEYDEWAIAWRTRVHAAYLDFILRAIERLAASANLSEAADLAIMALNADPSATDVECSLIWLYGQLGSRSAAETQYTHLAAAYRSDGLDPPAFTELIGPAIPG